MTHIDLDTLPRPTVQLLHQDGNALAIMGRCHRAATKAGWTDEQWSAFKHKAQSGNYDQLLQTVMQHFEVE